MIFSSKFLILRDYDLFKSLTDQQIEQIANQSTFEKFEKGSLIYQTGEDIKALYIVYKGSVKCGKESGNDKVLLKEIVYNQELLGENIFNREGKRSEFAMAIEDTEVFQIPVAFAKDLFSRNPELSQKLTLILINKMSKLESRMNDFVLKKAQSRISNFLKKLAEKQGVKIGIQEILINHGLSHKEIANITDTSRQTVARVLGDLKRQNIIHFSTRKPYKILIRDVMSLS